MDDRRALVILAGQLSADGHVGALLLMVDGFADVMQQAGALGQLNVRPQLRSHHAAQVADFDGMLEHVLAVAGAVAKTAQQLDQFGMDAMLTGLEHGLLAGLPDLVLHLLAGLFHALFDAGGMDSPVHDQFLDG